MVIIKKAHQTEKAFSLNKKNKYVFVVDYKATKSEVKKSVEAFYKVRVVSINSICYKMKRIVRYTKTKAMEGHRPRYKKIIVTLHQDDIIDIYASTAS